MKPFSYDLAVAYRIYPKVSTGRFPPPVFSDDKLKLAEFCLQSYKNSLGQLHVKMWVILNACPPEYEAMVKRVWGEEHLVVLHYPGVGPGTTVREQLRILTEQTDAEIVHFGEDDYFYLPDQMPLAVEFFRQTPEADFIAPYEGGELFKSDLNKMQFKQKHFCGKVWHSCIAATHTFMARRSSLLESQSMIHRLYVARKGGTIPDLGMWMALTKKRIFNPFKFLQWTLTHRWFWAGSIFLSWYYCWRQILFGRRYTLWLPQTCIANHMGVGLEAGGIDWQKEFQRQLASHPLGGKKN